MRYKEFLRLKLADKIPNNIPLPSGFHLVGYVALVHIKNELVEYSDILGEATLDFDSRIKSVAIRTGPTSGIERTPDYRLIVGDTKTVTTHIEAGIKYRIDPLRLTFSGGNKKERIHTASLVQPGDSILDMFACVGQFSIPMAKKGGAEVTAIELNPLAYRFLLENIRLNDVEDNITPILGDCREKHPVREVNRVVMGYLHDTHSYLRYALESLVEEGGFVHMHIGLRPRDVVGVRKSVEFTCLESGFRPEIDVRVVKEYAPNVKHYVFDILLRERSGFGA
ncbi:MAG: class I SAM-dependent methyltransferase family protein [Promethearchaeota archaeon]